MTGEIASASIEFIVLVVVVGIVWIIRIAGEPKRPGRGRVIRRWARRMGLNYEKRPADPRFDFHHGRFNFLDDNQVGPTNICSGKLNGVDVVAFDFPQGTGFARSADTTFSAILIKPAFGLKRIYARPKKIAPWLRLPTASKNPPVTESVEFNEAFDLHASDRRWALEFLSPRSMELMMWHQEEFGIESDGQYLAVFSDRPLDPAGFERARDFAAMLLEAIPSHARLEPQPVEDLTTREQVSDDPW